jgi:membrane fusion protein, heavy metal efflux system
MKRLLLTLFALSIACDRDRSAAQTPTATSPAAADHRDEPEHEELPRRVRLSERVISQAKLRTEPASKEVLAITVTLPGEIAVDPDKSARWPSRKAVA